MRDSHGLARPETWKRSLLLASVVVFGVRLFLTVYLAAAFFFVPRGDVLHSLYDPSGVRLLDEGWQGALLGVWQREDALWYEKIAEAGYSTADGTQDRFPLLPLLMKLVTGITGIHPVAAALLVSDASLLLGLFLLHRLLTRQFDSGTAGRTLAYIGLFPMAFFLHGPFSESLMLALAMAAFYLLERGKWVAALPVAYLAGLTRPQGLLIGIALAAQLIFQGKPLVTWRSIRWTWWSLPPVGSILLAPMAGLLSFVTVIDTAWRGPWTADKRGLWAYQGIMLPGGALLYASQRILAGKGHPIDLFDFAVTLLFLVLTAVACWMLDAGWAVYAVLFLVAPLSRFSPVFPLMSLSRYVLVLFPCFVVLAQWGRHRRVHLSVIFLWLSGLGFWTAMFYAASFVG